MALDDRRLVVELQSLGVRVEDETGDGVQGRSGGAGPSDAGFLWVRGLPLTVPMHADYARRSPYTLRIGERGARLELAGEYVAPVVVPPRPRIYDMHTADGVPYWKINGIRGISQELKERVFWRNYEELFAGRG